jgi:hypothetical protein
VTPGQWVVAAGPTPAGQVFEADHLTVLDVAP